MAGRYTSNTKIPEGVRNFFVYFRKYFSTKNVYEIRNFYQQDFHKISDRHFKGTSWPPPELVAPIVQNDKLFLSLYTELYYRHLHWKLSEKIDIYTRFDSWKCYNSLFSMLCNAPADTVVPDEWLYDIVDEYIYQFQAFCSYRTKGARLSDTEISLLNDNPDFWDVRGVTRTLYDVAKQSGILKPRSQGQAYTMLEKLGYFCVVGLCRLQLLLGDYASTMKLLAVLDRADIRQCTNVSACLVSLLYYRGFALLMTRQYVEAVKTFSKALVFVHRIGAHKDHSHHSVMVVKKFERMVFLLAIAHALSPGLRLTEHVRKMIFTFMQGQSQQSKMMEAGFSQMQGNGGQSLQHHENFFRAGCPKFVCIGNTQENDALQHQVQRFMNEVRHHLQLPKIHSMLKLYTTLPLAKLANLEISNASEEGVEALRRQLICLKYKTRADSTGSMGNATHFWMDNNVVHVHQEPKKKNFSGFFIHHLEKLDNFVQEIQAS